MAGEPITTRRQGTTRMPSWARAAARTVRRQIPAWRRVVVYTKLGAEGGLGNQLWEIAGTLGLAERHNADAAFNLWPYAAKFSMPQRYFPAGELTGHPAWTIATSIAEPFRVYLQDASLWLDIESRIRRYFAPTPDSRAAMDAKFSDLLAIPDKTSLHVRRGDYVVHPEAFSLLGEEYYRQALSLLKGSNVLVFSDDLDWCREHLGWARPVAYVEGNEDYEDLFLMTQCQQHVVANSSFSWWGAFLSDDRHPIVPKAWYGHEFRAGGIDESLMFLDGWVVIDA